MYKYQVSYQVWQYGSSFPRMLKVAYESKKEIDTIKDFTNLREFIETNIEDNNSVAIINIFPVKDEVEELANGN